MSQLKVSRLESDDLFHSVKSFLSSNPSFNGIPLSNLETCGTLIYNGNPFEGIFYALLNSEQVIGLAAHYWTGLLFVSWPVEHLSYLELALNQLSTPIRRVEGTEDAVSFISERFPEFTTTKKILLVLDLAVVSIDDINAVNSKPVDSDFDELARLRTMFLHENRCRIHGTKEIDPIDKEQGRQYVASMKDRIRILRDQSSIVAMLSYNGFSKESAMIGNMFVSPEHRRKGYARAIIKQAFVELKREDVNSVCLYTSNPADEALYKSVGFTEYPEPYCVMQLKP